MTIKAFDAYLSNRPMEAGDRMTTQMQSLVINGFREVGSSWVAKSLQKYLQKEADYLGGQAKKNAPEIALRLKRESLWFVHDPFAPFVDPKMGEGLWKTMMAKGITRDSLLYIHNAGSGGIAGMIPEELEGIKITMSEPEKLQEEILLHAYFSGIPNLDIRNSVEKESDVIFQNTYDAAIAFVRTGLPRPGLGDTPDLMKPDALFYADKKGDRHPLFAKDALDAISAVKPGGMVIVISHPFFMDYSATENGELGREAILAQAGLMGATRLAQSRFRFIPYQNYEGMQDVLVFRKRLVPGEKLEGEIEGWTKAVTIELKRPNGVINEYSVNQLFKDSEIMQIARMTYDPMSRPENGFGNQSQTGQWIANTIVPMNEVQKRPNPLVLPNGTNVFDELIEKLPDMTPVDPAYQASPSDLERFEALRESLTTRIRHGSDFAKVHFDGMYVLGVNNNVMVLENGSPEPVQKRMPAKTIQKIAALIPVRDAIVHLVDLENSNAEESEIEAARHTLNVAYDNFVSEHGPINAKENDVLDVDPFVSLLMSLEKNYDETTNSAEKEAIFFRRIVRPSAKLDRLELDTAIRFISTNREGRVNYPLLAALTKMPVEEIVSRLSGQTFFDPSERMPIMRGNYLSGNVRDKFRYATLGTRHFGGEMTRNLDALKTVIPAEIPSHDIFVQLGSPWLPPSDVAHFTKAIVTNNMDAKWQPGEDDNLYAVSHNAHTGWKVTISDRIKNAYRNNRTLLYGTEKVSVERLIEYSLNGSLPSLTKDKVDAQGNTVINPKTQRPEKEFDEVATEEARAKLENAKAMFSSWLRRDPSRMERMKEIYNTKYNAIVPRIHNDESMVQDGMIEDFTLREYQKEAVVRYLESGSLVLALPPGAGKTAIIAKTIEQAMNLGIVKKPAIVLPGHIAKQFAREYAHLYPTSKIMLVNRDNYTKESQENTLKMIRDGNFVTIYAASTFAKIPCGEKASIIDLENRYRMVQEALIDLRGSQQTRADISIEKRLDAELSTLKKEIEKAEHQGLVNRQNGAVYEDFGHDLVAIDEYHLLTKHAPIPGLEAAIGNVRVSNRAENILQKLAYTKSIRPDNHAVILSSGTPFTNNIPVESYTALYLVMKGRQMEELGIGNIRNYLSNFFEKEIIPQAGITGNMTMVPRYTAVRNRQELLSIFDRVMYAKNQEELGIPLPAMERIDVPIEPSEFEKRMTTTIAEKIDRSHTFSTSKLKYTTEIAKLSIDERLIDPYRGGNDDRSLIGTVVKNVIRINKETEDRRGTQLIFLDYGVPGGSAKIDLYADVRRRLVENGMNHDDIAFIHEEDDIAELVEQMKSGDKRVLILPTSKGTGLNPHERGRAIHFASLPWNPDAIDQGIRRFVRFGNTYDEVQVYFYPKEKLSSHRLTVLGGKASLISQLMDRNDKNRELDLRTNVDFVELLASATGNQDIYLQAKLNKTVKQLSLLKIATSDSNQTIRSKIAWKESDLNRLKKIDEAWTPVAERIARDRELVLKNEKPPVILYGPSADLQEKMSTKEKFAWLAKKLQTEPPKRKFGEVMGLPVIKTELGTLAAIVSIAKPGNPNDVFEETRTSMIEVGKLEDEAEAKIMRLVNSISREIESATTWRKKDIQKAEAEIAELEKMIVTFDKEEELNEAIQELEEVDRRVEAWKKTNLTNGGRESGIDALVPADLFTQAADLIRAGEIKNRSIELVLDRERDNAGIVISDGDKAITILDSRLHISDETSLDVCYNDQSTKMTIPVERLLDIDREIRKATENAYFVRVTNVTNDGSLAVFAKDGWGGSLGDFLPMSPGSVERPTLEYKAPHQVYTFEKGAATLKPLLSKATRMTGDPFAVENADVVKVSIKPNMDSTVLEAEAQTGNTFFKGETPEPVLSKTLTDQTAETVYIDKTAAAMIGHIAGMTGNTPLTMKVENGSIRMANDQNESHHSVVVNARFQQAAIANFPDISAVLSEGKPHPVEIILSPDAAVRLSDARITSLKIDAEGRAMVVASDGRGFDLTGVSIKGTLDEGKTLMVPLEGEWSRKLNEFVGDSPVTLAFQEVTTEESSMLFPVVYGPKEMIVGMPLSLSLVEEVHQAPVEASPQTSIVPTIEIEEEQNTVLELSATVPKPSGVESSVESPVEEKAPEQEWTKPPESEAVSDKMITEETESNPVSEREETSREIAVSTPPKSSETPTPPTTEERRSQNLSTEGKVDVEGRVIRYSLPDWFGKNQEDMKKATRLKGLPKGTSGGRRP